MSPSLVYLLRLFFRLGFLFSSASCFLTATRTSTAAPHSLRQQHVSRKRLSTTSSPTTDDRQSTETFSLSPADRARDFLDSFESAWNTQPATDIVNNFFIKGRSMPVDANPNNNVDQGCHTQPFWRDIVAFTWNICTNEGADAIERAMDATLPRGEDRKKFTTSWSLSAKPVPIQETTDGLDFWCNLKIATVGSGKAHFRLAENDNGDGYKIITLLTTLMELEDRPFLVGKNRIRGQIHGPIPSRKYWPEMLQEQQQQQSVDQFVVIVGGGQAGLALGARLHLMKIPYVILEAGPQPGTAWRNRYPSLHLHDPVYYNHMPYLPFPESWPILCPRDKIAEWMDIYAKTLDLNVRTNCRVTQVRRDGEDGLWRVQVQERTGSDNGSSQKYTQESLRTRNIVFATGNSSKPRIPTFAGQFVGRQLHSSEYPGGRSFANQAVVVVGSNNSGFDIAQDLWEQGAKSVTMIQRSPSMVVSTDAVLQHGLGPLYRQDAPLHHEDADLVASITPYRLLIPRWKLINERMQDMDRVLLESLVEAGYQLDHGPDGAGIFAKSATEGGGFYIDMGCADLLIRGDVGIRYASVSRLEEDKIVIVDKKTNQEASLPADTIVYATGFETMDQWVGQLCGEDILRKVGRTWGLGMGQRPNKDPGPWEGELRNMWKPTAVEGLWFHGGNLAQCRHYSRFLALQLAARYIGIETSVYGIPEATPPARQ